MAHWQFDNKPEDKFQDQLTLIQKIWYTQVKNQQKKAWTYNLKDILDQSKQSIDMKKYEHPIVTLDINFQKPVEGENLCVQFWYSPQIIY